MAATTRSRKSAEFRGDLWILKELGFFNYFQHLCSRESQNPKYSQVCFIPKYRTGNNLVFV